jgi:hypothetical protein
MCTLDHEEYFETLSIRESLFLWTDGDRAAVTLRQVTAGETTPLDQTTDADRAVGDRPISGRGDCGRIRCCCDETE